MLVFKEIEIEGFGSFVNRVKIELSGGGLNIIRGRVGSGKTTIPAALIWCLYGVHIKGNKTNILPWEEIRNDNYRGCIVVVKFELGGNLYEIIRCKDYKGNIRTGDVKSKGGNKLFFLVNGENVKSEKGKIKLQEKIVETIGYSYELFKNTIVFGQKMKRIIEETGPNKKKIFEEAFETTFIKSAVEKTQEDKNKVEMALRHLLEQNDRIEDKLINLENTKGELIKVIENSQELVNQYKEQIKKYQKEIKGIKALEKKDYEELIEKLNKQKLKETKVEKYNKSIQKAKEIIEEKKEGIKELEKLLNKEPNKCYTCNSILQASNYQLMVEKLQKELTTLKKEIKNYKEQASKKPKDIGKTKDKIVKLQNKIIKYKEHNRRVSLEQSRIGKIEKEIETIKKSLNKLDVEENKRKVKKIEKDIKNQSLTVTKNNKKLKKLNRAKEIKDWLLKDPLSNNGLKVYMFNELLNRVNEQLINYSNILGFRIEFGIDLSTRNKDFYQLIMLDNILIPYEDLSGGQKQLVDTSVAFAIHEVVTMMKPINLVFLDEPFESLGAPEVEVVTELVEEKAKGKTLFLITHHENFKPLNSNEIYIKLNSKKQTVINRAQ